MCGGGGGGRAPPLDLGPSDPGTGRGGGTPHTLGIGGGGAANPLEPKVHSSIIHCGDQFGSYNEGTYENQSTELCMS